MSSDVDYELQADVYRVIRNHVDKPAKRILKELKDHFGDTVSEQDLKKAILQLAGHL